MIQTLNRYDVGAFQQTSNTSSSKSRGSSHSNTYSDSSFEDVANTAQQLANLIRQSCPPSHQRELALSKISESLLWVDFGMNRDTSNVNIG